MSMPNAYDPNCDICNDPSFRGLPECYSCFTCGGHIAADSTTCDYCGYDWMMEENNESA